MKKIWDLFRDVLTCDNIFPVIVLVGITIILALVVLAQDG